MDKEKSIDKFKDSVWRFREKRRLKCRCSFINRSKGREKMVMVLAGYKDYLYGTVFRRLKDALTDDIDVCIISSGKFVPELDEMCKKEGWSYLPTKQNQVSLVQNAAINFHPNAKYIFKLDEDIFLCKDYFKKMMCALQHAKEGQYRPGVIAPLIPINGYGHVRIIEKLNLTEKYTELFEKPIYAAGQDRLIETSAEVAKFFWGEGGYIPSIDELDRRFGTEPLEERPCPIRFSIGAILFERSLWENMHYLPVRWKFRSGMGWDEEDICSQCISTSRPIMVSENTVVGHFSFGPQNTAMREYFDSRQDVW